MNASDIKLLEKTLKENDIDKAIEFSSKLSEDAYKTGDYIFSYELTLVKAVLASTVGEDKMAQLAFSDFHIKFSSKIPLVHYTRGDIFYCRYLLKNGELDQVKNRILNIRKNVVKINDPLLTHDYYLLKSELDLIRNATESIEGNTYISTIIQYIKSTDLARHVYGEKRVGTPIYGRLDPMDMVLRYFSNSSDTQSFLNWLETAKVYDLNHFPTPGCMPLVNLEDSKTQKFTEIENKFIKDLESYSNYLTITNKNKDDASSMSPMTLSDQEYFEERDMSRKSKSLENYYETYMQEVQNLNKTSFLTGLVRKQPQVSLSKLQNLMDEKTALLNYYSIEDGIYILIITKVYEKTLFFEFNKEEMAEQIIVLQDEINYLKQGKETEKPTEVDAALARASDIYNKIVEPVTHHLENINRLVICPDNSLFQLPFHYLWDGKDFLMDKYQIQIFPAANLAEAHLEKTALNFSPVVNNPTELMKIIKQLFSPKPTEGETKPEDFKCEFLRKYLVIFDSIYDRNQKNLLNFKVKIPGATEPTLKDIFLEKYMPKLAIISTGVFEGSENLNQLLLDIKTLVYLFFYLGIECVLITDLGGGQSTSHPSTYSEKLENRLANKIKEQVFGSLVLPELEDLSFFKIPLQLKEIFCCSNKLLTPPCIEENQMIFGGEDTFLYSVNPLDGKSLWKVKCGDWIKYPPVIEDGMVYLGGIDKRVRAIHAFDGKQKWQFGTSGWIMGTPVVEKTKIYFASKDNSIYVIDKFKGTRIVSKDIEAKIITTLWMSGNTLIIQDGELFLQAFSATTLNKLWEKKLNSKIKKGIIYENLFIYSDEEGHLEAITTHKAHIKWRRTLGKPAVFLDVDKQRKLIVLNQRGILLYYNVTTGKSEWEYNKINPVFEAPGIDDRFIWIFSSDNHLVGLSKNTGSPNIDIPLYLKSVKCINAYQDNVIISDEQGLVIRIPIKDLNYKTYKDDWKCRKTSSVNFLFPLISQDKMGAFEVEINDDKEVIEVIDQETGEVIKKEKKTAQKTKHSLFNTETRITAPMKLIDDGTSHLLMIATQGKFLAVFTDLSQEKWSVNIENIISEPMEFYRGLIVATTIMGEYYVIDPRGGKLTWSKKICRKFNTTPRIKKRLLFVGGDDGVVFCISIASGKIEWKVIVGKDIQSAPLMLRKSLVVVNNEGRVLNLDMETGRIIWSYNTLSTVTYNPVILNDDKIIITCKESYIFCLNPMGKVVWKFVYPGDSFVGEPLVSGKIMFAGLKSGELLAIDTRRGTLARKTHLPENLSVNPILCKDHLIAGTIHGKIFAWDTEKGNTYLIKEMEDPVFHPMVYHKKYIYVIQGEDTIVRVPFKKKAPTAEAGAEQKTQETSQQPDTDTREMPLPDLNQSEPSTIPDSQERFDAQQMNVSGRLTRDGRPLEQGTYRRTSILDRVNTSQEQEDEDSALSRYSPMILLLITIIAIVAKLMENEVLFQSSIAFGGLFLIIIILDQVTMEGSRVKRYMNRLVPSGMLDRLSGNTVEKEISLIFQDSPNLNQALAPLNQKEARFVIQKINEISYDVVLKNGGYVLSNPGRGIYIAFNVGGNLYNHATLALESALTINRRISRLQNEIQQKLGRRLPAKIKVDFGIVSGKAHVGYRGSGKQMEPYVVGSMPDKATEFSDMLRDSEYNILINNETNRQLDGRFKIEDLGEKNLNSTKGTERVYGVVTR